MKKPNSLLFYALVMTILFIPTLSTAQLYHYWENMYPDSLKGNIRTLTESTYVADPRTGELPGEPYSITKTQYNNAGNPTKKETTDNKNITREYTYLYNEHRLLTQINGKLVKEDILFKVWTFTYDAENKPIEQKEEYKAFGRKDHIIYAYTYDNQVKYIHKKELPAKKKTTITENYHFDEQNRLIKLVYWHDPDNIPHQKNYTYHENGNIQSVEEILGWCNEVICGEMQGDYFEYNEMGDPIKKEFLFYDAYYTFEYEYDNLGNWIKRYEYRNPYDNSPTTLYEYIEREIIYYQK